MMIQKIDLITIIKNYNINMWTAFPSPPSKAASLNRCQLPKHHPALTQQQLPQHLESIYSFSSADSISRVPKLQIKLPMKAKNRE